MKEHGVIGKPVTAKKQYQCSRGGGTADGTAAETTQQYQGSREDRSRVTPVVFDPKVHGVLKCLRRRLCHRATCGCDLGRKRRLAGLLDVM